MELSVRFFKRLILVALALMIAVPTVLAVRFGTSLRGLRAENEELRDQLSKTQAQLAERLALPPGEQGMGESPAPELSYQSLYPQLYCDTQRPEAWAPAMDTVYLTFDDGPSSSTPAILDALDAAGVKAAFFVTGRGDGAESRAMLKEIVDRGHSVGVLTYSHDYRDIYRSVENYLADFEAAYQMIYEATGVKPDMFRFPGGSINSYNTQIYKPLIAEMLRRGFVFYDWNVAGVDSIRGATADSVVQTVLSDLAGKDRAIVELHDTAGKTCTAEAVPRIVEELTQRGYTFEPLTAEVLPIVFSYDPHF